MTLLQQFGLAACLPLMAFASGCDQSASTPAPVLPPHPQKNSTHNNHPSSPKTTSGAGQAPHQVKSTLPDPNDPWVVPDERHELYLDFTLTDQDGQRLKLSDFTGKPMAISFIFTRCPLPKMCPLITATMANLQRLTQKAKIDNDVQLLLISYDPGFDTPTRLKKYGTDHGILWTNAKMLQPDETDTTELLHELDIGVIPQVNGTIGHFIELVLVDHKGRAARNSRDTIWNNHVVLSQLKNLISEMISENQPANQ